ncbi:hypothetical protein B0H14DRAFT_2577483 [Mycena olivaceomarginata]|nr:hypothetical protein B0H14DRAFT_2577483 [Mycena olivaceomarginata]
MMNSLVINQAPESLESIARVLQTLPPHHALFVMNTAQGRTEASSQMLLLTQKRLVQAQGEKLLLAYKIRALEEELAKTRFKSKSTLGEMETRVKPKNTSVCIESRESPGHSSTRSVLKNECNSPGDLVAQVEGVQELVNGLEAALGRLRGDIDEVLGDSHSSDPLSTNEAGKG